MIKTVAALAAVLSLSACATLTRGTTQSFEVKSMPSGAQVKTDNGLFCESTPCVFKNVARNSTFNVTITKDGYEPQTARVTNTTQGEGGVAMAGNLLVGGFIGAGIDATNGSMQDLTPNPLEVTLVTAGTKAAPAAAPAAAPVAEVASTTQAGS